MAMGFRCIAWVHKLLTGCFCMNDTERQDDVHIVISTPDTERDEIVEQVEEEESSQAKIEFELEFCYLETEYWEKRELECINRANDSSDDSSDSWQRGRYSWEECDCN
ncbi:hypothetical protein GIB67_029881 [Kingdonia uniflora]|uniref:Uncharacterized protein n=1 Tax=Kingdonia uniflora TaxID=39325 RepID=A0A7J7NJG5_9MAGN|nr:hypothetical protein GIB67_029881 [Kingdonia uniflora]